MKLQLLRKQTILNNVAYDVVSHSSLSKLGWWKPLESNSKDNVTMTIDAPVSLSNTTVSSFLFIF